jgi:hypothetical protein
MVTELVLDGNPQAFLELSAPRIATADKMGTDGAKSKKAKSKKAKSEQAIAEEEDMPAGEEELRRLLDGNVELLALSIAGCGIGGMLAYAQQHPDPATFAGCAVDVWVGEYDVRGVAALAQGLRHNSTLVRLNLEDSSIGSEGLDILCTTLLQTWGADDEGVGGEEDREGGGDGTHESAIGNRLSFAPLSLLYHGDDTGKENDRGLHGKENDRGLHGKENGRGLHGKENGRGLHGKENDRGLHGKENDRGLHGKGAHHVGSALRVLNLSNCRLMWGAQQHTTRRLRRRQKRHRTGQDDGNMDDDDPYNQFDYIPELNGITALGELLASPRSLLACLDLSSNDLTGPHCDVKDGVQALKEGLQRNRSLKVLDLRNNDVLDLFAEDELRDVTCCDYGNMLLLSNEDARMHNYSDEVFARAELRDAYHELIQRKAPQSAVSAILENFTEVLMAL